MDESSQTFDWESIHDSIKAQVSAEDFVKFTRRLEALEAQAKLLGLSDSLIGVSDELKQRLERHMLGKFRAVFCAGYTQGLLARRKK